jgi:hypothetical protein
MQIFSKYFLVGSVFLTGFGLLGFDSVSSVIFFPSKYIAEITV